DVVPEVGRYAALGEAAAEIARARRAQGEEAAQATQRNRAVAVDDAGRQVEVVEGGGEEDHLVLAHFAQESGRQVPLGEEVEDLGRPVVAGGVVGRAGEARAARPVGDRAAARRRP